MATVELADLLQEKVVEPFRAEPFYEHVTDSLIYYVRDERSYGQRISKHLTVFLSMSDDTLVGLEIKGMKTILSAIHGMEGTIPLADPVPVADENGDDYELSVLVRQAMVRQELPVAGEEYDRLHEVSRGIRVNPRGLCEA